MLIDVGMPKLGESRLLHSLQREELTAILDQAVDLSLKAGTWIFRQGEPADRVFLLVTGRVRIARVTAEGSDSMLTLVGPSELFGFDAFEEKSAYHDSARAIRDCRVASWEGQVMRPILLRYPSFSLNALRAMLDFLHQLEVRYSDLANSSVEQRIARALVDTARRLGTVERNLIVLEIADRDIGELAATNKYSVSRTLGAWRKLGLIKKTQGKIILLDINALAHPENVA
jgi:CRP-like cAMP-binding protein